MRLPEGGVLPVIHMQSTDQVVEMAGLSQEAGASGVFVIDHKPTTMSRPEHLQIASEAVNAALPELWVGMNCLYTFPKDSVLIAARSAVHGVWVDDAVDVNPNGTEESDYKIIDMIRQDADICYFGGIAMKGAGYVDSPTAAAEKIAANAHRVNVAVTSGPSTGQPASIERLRTIRELNPDVLLAVASGVNAINVAAQARLADYLLVASSIEISPMSGVFDMNKLRKIICLAKAAQTQNG